MLKIRGVYLYCLCLKTKNNGLVFPHFLFHPRLVLPINVYVILRGGSKWKKEMGTETRRYSLRDGLHVSDEIEDPFFFYEVDGEDEQRGGELIVRITHIRDSVSHLCI
ncbi:unnamed protein product [Amoebophrya sp. A25]|nr:unnamed protein product [Amoebophrya sp. A25]|eukprot:GSA25T00025560001.1